MLPSNTTLTALVRELLESEIRRRRMARSASEYVSFLEKHPDEAEELEGWATAPLDASPARRVRRTRSSRKRR